MQTRSGKNKDKLNEIEFEKDLNLAMMLNEEAN